MCGIKILKTDGQGEIIEKKSRFIATVRRVDSEEEASAFFDEMKKKYWDARHNCYAVVIGDNNEFTRCSDDGEPSGTAGRPMLDVLLNEGLHNAAVVVTRYFGGVLLGTGGLVRAYQAAVKEGLGACCIVTKRQGIKYVISTDYTYLTGLQNFLEKQDCELLDIEYTEKIKLTAVFSAENADCIVKNITEMTCARAEIEKMEACTFIK